MFMLMCKTCLKFSLGCGKRVCERGRVCIVLLSNIRTVLFLRLYLFEPFLLAQRLLFLRK